LWQYAYPTSGHSGDIKHAYYEKVKLNFTNITSNICYTSMLKLDGKIFYNQP
jgi:hypothetical protein